MIICHVTCHMSTGHMTSFFTNPRFLKKYEKLTGKCYTKKEMVDEMDSATWDRQNGVSMDADPKTVGQSIPKSNF